MMDYAEVDTADFVGIVVEQGDDAVGVFCINDDFFGDFAFDGGKVGVVKIGIEQGHIIGWIYMATDTDGAKSDEACFACAFSPDVAEEFTAVTYEDVGDELFLGGVFFGLRAGNESRDALRRRFCLDIFRHRK